MGAQANRTGYFILLDLVEESFLALSQELLD